MKTIGSRFGRLLLAVLLGLTASMAEAGSYNRLVVFGDSLSDPGNFNAAFGLYTVAPYAPIPPAPYAVGGMHFSNGPTWIEQLATEIHLRSSAGSALRYPGVASNYAVGGARARAGAEAFPYFDLGTQTSMFIGQGLPDPGQALYVIWIGGNDERDALAAAFSGGDVSAIIGGAVTATADNILALWSAGARQFLVLPAPDFAFTPFVTGLGPLAQGAASQISAAYNGYLDQALTGLRALPGIRIRKLNVNTLLERVIARGGSEGIRNVSTPCLSFNVVENAICAHPGQYLFWDGLHLTRAGHALVAEAAEERLSR
jgi:phospholipase/lecithinase/hemolysin